LKIDSGIITKALEGLDLAIAGLQVAASNGYLPPRLAGPAALGASLAGKAVDELQDYRGELAKLEAAGGVTTADLDVLAARIEEKENAVLDLIGRPRR
jgi:hypothetical protein